MSSASRSMIQRLVVSASTCGLIVATPVLAYHQIDHLEPDAPTFVPAIKMMDPAKLKAIQDSIKKPPAPAAPSPATQSGAKALYMQVPDTQSTVAPITNKALVPKPKDVVHTPAQSKTATTKAEPSPGGSDTGGGDSYAPLGYEPPAGSGQSSAATSNTPSLPSAPVLARRQGSIIEGSGFSFQPLTKDSGDTQIATDTAFEPREINAATSSMADAQTLAQFISQHGYRLVRRRNLKNLGFVLSTFLAPDGRSAAEAADELQRAVPQILVDLNHLYVPLADATYANQMVAWRADAGGCSQHVRIALIDSAVDTGHAALSRARVRVAKILPAGITPAPAHHGTAVASLLVGNQPDSSGLLPHAELISIPIFRQRERKRIDTNAEWIVRALDQASAHRVSVINLSLGGPPNKILEFAVRAVWGNGIAIVSAAGNGGANAPPAYPAAYPEVIAVTAVDARRRIFERANRGDYIELAAPGVDVLTAAPGGNEKYVTGTSFAAPFVTAAWAALRSAYSADPADTVRARLVGNAIDLGAPGRDPVFGFGLVQWGVHCRQAAAK